jgi:hypothetical protein
VTCDRFGGRFRLAVRVHVGLFGARALAHQADQAKNLNHRSA